MWTRAMKGGVQRGRHCHGAGAHSETNVWRAERCEERCRESGVERSGERCGEEWREVWERGGTGGGTGGVEQRRQDVCE